MKNQYFQGTPTTPRFALCPTGITAGMPVLIGDQPAVAVDNYQSNEGGTTFYFTGSFLLSVIAVTQISPAVNAAAKPGDALFARGTLDTTTNVTYNLTISLTPGDAPFGHLDPSDPGISSGATDTAAIVRLGDA